MMHKKEVKRIAIGSITALVSFTVIFSGVSLGVKAIEASKTEVIETNYNILDNGLTNDQVPEDYEQQDYKVKFVGKDQPTKNDLKIEEAAELTALNVWSIFREDLSGQTIEMDYEPTSKLQPRPVWSASVWINENLSYELLLDAVTGESYWIGKTVYHRENIREGLNMELLNNHEEYQQIVKKVIEKHQLFSTDIETIKYVSQGFEKNEMNNKNANITFEARSKENEKAQLTISTYNKELVSIGYDGWLEAAVRFEKQLEKELNHDAEAFKITEELFKEVEETKTPIIMNE